MERSQMFWTVGVLVVALPWVGGACDLGPTVPAGAVDMELALENLPPLDPATAGVYEAWTVGPDDRVHSAGRFEVGDRVTVTSPIGNPTDLFITVEPPGDRDNAPSQQKVIGGIVSDGVATLGTNRYLTSGVPLEEQPGTHVLFTPSDNAETGYPSNEDAGIWLFIFGGDEEDGSFFLVFTPLGNGWTYEGWMVRDYGSPGAVWLSYGKFEPDEFRKARFRDDTGLGPFSGQIDYEQAMPDEIIMPGDDWIANPHGYPVPGNLELPLDLNGCNLGPENCEAQGQVPGPSRYTHVITIEPRLDEDEAPWLAQPYFIRPYRNPIGEDGPGEPRVIEFHPEELPGGTARILGPAASG